MKLISAHCILSHKYPLQWRSHTHQKLLGTCMQALETTQSTNVDEKDNLASKKKYPSNALIFNVYNHMKRISVIKTRR